jgi:hypothetical protein
MKANDFDPMLELLVNEGESPHKLRKSLEARLNLDHSLYIL